MPGPKFNNSSSNLENAKLRETNMYISPNFGDNSLHLQTRLSKNLDALPTFYVEPFETRVVETYTIVNGKRIKNTYRLSDSGRSYGIGTEPTNAYTFQNDVQNLVLEDNSENVITIENVGSQLISEAVNLLDPSKLLRETFVIYDIDNDINYIFTGEEQFYGANEETEALESQFVVIPNEPEFPQSLSEINDDIGATELEIIKVTEKSQIVNIDLDPTKVYKILKSLELTSQERIRLDNSPIIQSLGADLITISTSEPDSIIFEGNNCKNVNIQNINLTAAGNGSKAFDVINAEGNHEFRLVGVNFTGSESAGNVTGFRQWFTKDIGLYGCKDGFTLYGSFNGMFCQELNLFGFSALGTLFKKGENLSFTNRAFISVNFAVPNGAVLADFDESVFLENELFQLVNCIAKVDGGFNDDNVITLVPNISANSPKSLWSGNSGLPNTAIEKIVIDDNVNGSYEIDWLNDTYDLTLTGDTTFTEKNLPASGRRTKTLNISLSGDFTPTFPDSWVLNQIGTYKGSDLNDISIKFISVGKYAMKISNSLTVYPAPILGSVDPVSVLPNSTSQVILRGQFFTPEGVVVIENQTINSIEYDADTGSYILSVTTGSEEGEFDITISNGTSVTFLGRFIVNLGEVFIPSEQDWQNVSNTDVTESGKTKIVDLGLTGSADWLKELDITKDFIVKWRYTPSSINPTTNGRDSRLLLVNKNSLETLCNFRLLGSYYAYIGSSSIKKNINVNIDYDFTFEKIGASIISTYYDVNGVKQVIDFTNDLTFTENLFLKVSLKNIDIVNIKYIEIP